jgi:amidohydrolase
MDVNQVKGLNDGIIKFRRDLHRIPEVGLDLPETKTYVFKALMSMGLFPKECGHGITCDVGDGEKFLAIRADMDALPVTELTNLPFSSEHPGKMHACGHDAHTAVLLGVAKYFSKHNPPCKIRLIFQPGEEGYFGAVDMIENGALEGVQAAIGGHVGPGFEEVPTGTFMVKKGPASAAADDFRITFRGQGTHGSQPHKGKDPFMPAADFVLNTQVLVARETDANNPAVISVGSIHGGTANNIIPDSVEITGTVRTVTKEDRELLSSRLDQMVKSLATGYGVNADFSYHFGYIPMYNNPQMCDILVQTIKESLGENRVVVSERANMGGEDMAYFLEKVPGVFYFFNTNNAEKGITAPNHSPYFNVDEDVLWMMAAADIVFAEHFASV